MRVEIKDIDSTDIEDLKNYRPTGEFYFHVDIDVGAQNEKGSELFQVKVCSPEWLKNNRADDVVNGRGMMIMNEFHFEKFENFIQKTMGIIEGENWDEIMKKLSRFARWYSEDLKE